MFRAVAFYLEPGNQSTSVNQFLCSGTGLIIYTQVAHTVIDTAPALYSHFRRCDSAKGKMKLDDT